MPSGTLSWAIVLDAAAAAAAEAELSDGKPIATDEEMDDGIDEDEAAEILEAMLGLAPAMVAAVTFSSRLVTTTYHAG